jgi:hypothetical protein
MSGRLPQAAGLDAEAKAGVPKESEMRDSEGPGPLTQAFGVQSRADTSHFRCRPLAFGG